MLSAVRCGDGVNEAVGCCVVVYCVVQYSTVLGWRCATVYLSKYLALVPVRSIPRTWPG